MKYMKVALVYDRINKWGGAERVLLTLHEMFPDAPLFTSVYSKENASWAEVFPKVFPSFVNRIALVQKRHELLPFFMPIIFEMHDFSAYDLVISVTSEAAKGIITKSPTYYICYCLTPTRYLWSHYDTYFKGSTFKVLAKPVVEYLRRWDKVAARRPDVMVAISKAVQTRIKKYYGRESKIIHPPVDVDKFSVDTSLLYSNEVKKKFYLVVSRLVPYKRVDLAVKAFNRLKLPLIIVGIGSEERKLKKMAKGNIVFVGQLTDEELSGYYKRCAALLMPQEEDFGLVAVEANASGAPVLAYKAGGALDVIEDGKSGVFFDKQSVEGIIKAVRRFQGLKFRPKDLRKNASRFSKEEFKKRFKDLILKYGRL